jgi:protein AroM
MAPLLGAHVRIDEFGALDGLDAAALAALAPREGQYRFATRMRDGTQIELDAAAAEARLAQVMGQADAAGYDVLVPLCTGTAIAPMRTLVVEPQQVVDHLVAGLAAHCRKVGLVVPLQAQVDAFHMVVPLDCDTLIAHASPYEADAERAARNFEQAGRDLASCDLIVMHCMGYAERMRQAVARASGRPVLLSNRLVAQTLAQILGPGA